jgi:hypothetical protein
MPRSSLPAVGSPNTSAGSRFETGRVKRIKDKDGSMSRLVSYDHYVAGWLDSSVRDFFDVLRPARSLDSLKYSLITCLDSDPEPAALLNKNAVPGPAAANARLVGRGLLLPTKHLLENDCYTEFFSDSTKSGFFRATRSGRNPMRHRSSGRQGSVRRSSISSAPGCRPTPVRWPWETETD